MANQFPLTWPHTNYGEMRGWNFIIMHAHVKSIYTTVMGSLILVEGRWNNIWDWKEEWQSNCFGHELTQSRAKRLPRWKLVGMNGNSHVINWGLNYMTIEVYTVYLCASKWRRVCIKKVGLVQSQCRSVVEVRICHVTANRCLDTGIM